MFKNVQKHKAQSSTEIMALVMFVLIAMLVFQKYIARGLYGRWKSVGDSLGQSRLYDPNTTIECGHDRWEETGTWYNAVCFDEECIDDCVAATRTRPACITCMQVTCQSSYGGEDVCNKP